MRQAKSLVRCGWVTTDPLYIKYHDKEWGVPIHDDERLFEFLILEGAQAGLSWITVLKNAKITANFLLILTREKSPDLRIPS